MKVRKNEDTQLRGIGQKKGNDKMEEEYVIT